MVNATSAKEGLGALSAEAIEMLATRFRILGEPLRVRLVQELQNGENTVSQLVDAVAASQPNVSKHLRILRREGIVGRRSEGNLGYYFITDETVVDLCNAVCASPGDRLSRDANLAAELHRGMTARLR
jgi:DNA-binding transcriptional ArsR family regulator